MNIVSKEGDFRSLFDQPLSQLITPGAEVVGRQPELLIWRGLPTRDNRVYNIDARPKIIGVEVLSSSRLRPAGFRRIAENLPAVNWRIRFSEPVSSADGGILTANDFVAPGGGVLEVLRYDEDTNSVVVTVKDYGPYDGNLRLELRKDNLPVDRDGTPHPISNPTFTNPDDHLVTTF